MKKPTENKLVEFKIDGGSIVFEGVDDSDPTERHLVSRGSDNSIAQAKQSLHQAIDTAKSAAELVLNSFKEMNSPDEINLEFGVKMSAKSGVIIASAGGEANFKIGLKWKKPST